MPTTYVIRAFGSTLILNTGSGITPTQALTLLDTIATSIAAYNANFFVGDTSQLQAINTGVANLATRIAASANSQEEQGLLSQAQDAANRISAYHATILDTTQLYPCYFSFFNALDLFLGGLNTYLTTNTLQVSAWAAQAYNAWVAQAIVQSNRASSPPIAITTANIFPYAAVDPMISFTTGTGTVIASTTAGSASSSQGGGVGPLYLYKTSSGNAAGGAILTITYTNAAGASVTTTVSTTGITGSAANVAAGGAVNLNVNAQAVTLVTGTGMTSGEIYSIGTRLVRSVAY